jgi:antitoxin component YwqK of YwqJK toxin-antitoxin module
MKNLILIILTTLLFSSCKTECRKVISTHENGNEEDVHSYLNCKDTTVYKRQYFFENGQLGSEGVFSKGLKEGVFKRWTEDGVLTAIWNNKKGKSDGLVEFWFDNGIKKREVTMDNGVKNGIYKNWNKEGFLEINGYYFNDKQDSTWYYYEDYGTVIIINYKNDLREGKLYEKNIDSDSNITIIIGQYKNDLKTGEWNWLDKDSLITLKRTYKEGGINNESTSYYKNGSIKAININKNDSVILKKFFYDIEGNITLKNGAGKTYSYYNDGTIKYVGNYKNSLLSGISEWYNQKGQIEHSVMYENDSIITFQIAHDINGNITLKNGAGKMYNYYNNGTIKCVGNYKNSLLSGISKCYYQNGQIEQSSMYENGLLKKVTHYFKNGIINKIQKYKSGSIKSIQIAHDINGNIILENGTGKVILYFDTEEIEYEAEYINSKRTGVAKWYYKNGQLKKSTLFKNDLRIEVLDSFDKNGKKRDPGTLKGGNGTWIEYGENGVIEKTDTYKNGILTKPNNG